MDIRIANPAGFCFGVSQIDQKAQDALNAHDKTIYSYGPLVHNSSYVKRREAEGIHVLEDWDAARANLDADSVVILRAHGVTREERRALEETGATLIDGTCPVLLGIYRKAQAMEREGYRILVVGDPEHPEVKALVSYLHRPLVVQTPEEAAQVTAEEPLFVISQTTNRRQHFDAVVAALPVAVRHVDLPTICQATRKRQQAAAQLAQDVDAMIVVGGLNSSNTEKLRQVVEKEGIHVQKVEEFGQLTLQEWSKFNRIGVTAGASTPDWIIEEVVRGMENFSREDFMEQIEDSMVKIFPRDIVKGTVIAVKDDEVYVDIRYRADGIIKSDEMTDEERKDTHQSFHEGDEIDVYVIKMDDGEGNVVLSTRRVEGLKNWEKLVEKYEAGETVEAQITGENRGGLVANVMGINGFIPASQIATYFVKNFKQYVGQTVTAKFLSIDERKRRVVLSIRAVLEEQLDDVWEKIVVGEKVKGKVVRMTDFGAFVDLGGVDGLIHVSDISWQRIEKPSDVLEIGQEVEPVVLKANRDRNRISLGLKQLTPKPFEIFKQNNKPGDVVKGTIVNLLDFGAFVRLDEGVEGLIHVSQIAHRHVEKPSDEFNVGQELEVKILDIDEERQRIALSTRALEEPKDHAADEAAPEVEGEAPFREAQYDASRFERREAPQKPQREKRQPREKKQQPKISFSTGDDIGTNLGDLIAAQMGLLNEEVEEPEETEAQASAEESVETAEVETTAEEVAEEPEAEESAEAEGEETENPEA